MKKFKFRLETVLNERKKNENIKLRDWTLAQRILQTLANQKIQFEKRLNEACSEATQLAELPINSSAEFYTIDNFIKGIKLLIQWKEQEIERATKLTQKKYSEYVQASQKRKILEKLKEKRTEEFKKAIHKKELKELDDLYIMRAHFLENEITEIAQEQAPENLQDANSTESNENLQDANLTESNENLQNANSTQYEEGESHA